MGRDMPCTQDIDALKINHDRVRPELDRRCIAYVVGTLSARAVGRFTNLFERNLSQFRLLKRS